MFDNLSGNVKELAKSCYQQDLITLAKDRNNKSSIQHALHNVTPSEWTIAHDAAIKEKVY